MVTKKKAASKAEEKPEDAPKEKKAKKVKDSSNVAAAKPKKKAVKKLEEEPEAPARVFKPFITAPKPVVTPPPPKVAPVITPPPAPAPVAPVPVVKAPVTPPVTPPAAPVKPKPTDVKPAAPVVSKHAPARPTPPPVPVKPKVEIPVAVKKPIEKKPEPVRHAAPVASKEETPKTSERKKIIFNEMMAVKDLATAMEAKVTDVIKKLLTLGTPASINQRLSFDIATLVADSFGFDLEMKSLYVEEEKDVAEPADSLKPRSPVVTVMGHVDHGKTSLLDAIRSTSVVKTESGGITQHIGAYQVKVEKGAITFLDTPGHEAFTAMRARGAMVTDLVVLVVAADDSVMPQTIEAIDHAKAAEVPIVVAINKVDLPTANVQRVKQELAQHNLVAEDWGGKTIMVEVSARTGQNVAKLLEMILLEAEILDLKANPNRAARGIVLEAHMDPRRGITATMLCQAGTLRVGDVIVCGLTQGRVRAMFDEAWKTMEEAGPAVPARILGLAQVPQVGDQMSVVSSEREAREISERRREFMKDAAHKKKQQVTLESLHSQIAEGKLQDLPIIVKTDVQGSMQAIQDSIGKIPNTSIQIRIVHSGVGNINESDVLLAEASDAIVLGFHVKTEAGAESEAKRAGVDIRTYQIIYEMLADIRAAMEGLLKPEEREVVKGRAQVKEVYPSSKYGAVAGVMVLEGKVVRGGRVKVSRQGQIVGEGSISSLRRFKDDMKEVEKGYECGLSVEGIKTFLRGDVLEVIVIEKHARRLEA